MLYATQFFQELKGYGSGNIPCVIEYRALEKYRHDVEELSTSANSTSSTVSAKPEYTHH